MKKLGKHRTGKVCLHIGRLADVDMKVLKELVVVTCSPALVRYVREKPVVSSPRQRARVLRKTGTPSG